MVTRAAVTVQMEASGVKIPSVPHDVIVAHPSPPEFENLICLYSISADTHYILDTHSARIIYQAQHKPTVFIEVHGLLLIKTVLVQYARDTHKLLPCGRLEEDTFLCGCFIRDRNILIMGHAEYMRLSLFELRQRPGEVGFERRAKHEIGVHSGGKATKSILKLQLAWADPDSIFTMSQTQIFKVNLILSKQEKG
jgi:hypothetical protein